MAKMNPN